MAETTIREAVAAFHDPEALKAAVSDLQSNGFDRADISFVARDGFEGNVKPDYREARQIEDDPGVPRDAVIDETDIRQRRTLEVGMLATVAAFAAAGFTVMTGGATALAAGVAVVAMGGVGGVAELVGKAYGEGQQNFLRQQLDRGGILLWVRTPDGAAEARAEEVLRRHSADDVHIHEVPVAG